MARRNAFAGQLLAAFHRADAETRQIVVARSIHAGHLGGFPADQSAAGLFATIRNARNDALGHAVLQLAGGEVIEEEQWLGALDDQVVDAHGDEIDAHRVVPAAVDRQLQLRADTVIARHQQRILVPRRFRIEETAETTDFAVRTGAHRRLHQRADCLDQSIARLDRDTRLFIGVGGVVLARFVTHVFRLTHSRLDFQQPFGKRRPVFPMIQTLSLTPALRRTAVLAAVLAGLCALGVVVWAQVGGERGIAPIASSSDIEVMGIEVDVRAESGSAAREQAWEEAQRKAWARLDGPSLSDSQIAGLVSAIVIERERLGPKRYIATLGVVFDRQRASRYLGAAGEATRSAPMLLLPVTISAGTQMVYEQRNPWQRAWAEFQAGQSRIDYVRPAGAGGDSLLLTYGQTGRRSRTWWRNALDQFGAADVLVPIAQLRYTYPGGPIEGTFTARFGPDNEYLDGFDMTAASPAELPAMLERAVVRFDRIFTLALADGKLRPDPTLNIGTPELDPALQRLLDLGRALRAQERAAASASQPTAESGDAITAAPIQTPPPEGSVALYTVQVATPDAAAFDGSISAVRGTPGVRSTGVRSTAIGGTSVMTVSYAGSIAQLADALRARGFTVRQGSNALAISR